MGRTALFLAVILAACGTAIPPGSATIEIPNAPRAFDHAVVDDATRTLFLADRSNGAVDLVDLTTERYVARVGGFSRGGPNGVELVADRGELWAADGDSSVKVIDLASRTVVATIPTRGQGRTDDLAYDAKDRIVVVGNDSDPTPFLTFISTTDRRVLGRLEFPGALGLEEVHWRPERDLFYQAIPSTSTASGGEIAAIDPVTMKVTAHLPLRDCGPHGIALGPGDDIFVGCGTSHVLVVDGQSGTILATIPQVGDVDVVWYDPHAGRYLAAGAGSGGAAVGLIDAKTRTWRENVATGNGAHTVVADPRTGRIYVPIPGSGLMIIAR